MAWRVVLTFLAMPILFGIWKIIRPLFVKSQLSELPGPPKLSYIFGNFTQLFNINGWKFHLDLIEKYGHTLKVHFFFGDERVYTVDPLALHHIFVKYQHIYEEAPFFLAINRLNFGTSLLSTLGDHHKRQRKMLNPVFSIKHMRGLIPIFYPVSYQLRDILIQKAVVGDGEVNVMQWVSRAALEYIGRGGFGYAFDALNHNTRSPYEEAVKMLVPLSTKLFLFRPLLPTMMRIGTPYFRRKVVEWTPIPFVQQLRAIIDLMHRTAVDIYSQNIDALTRGDEVVHEQIGKGHDIMSILLKANADAMEEDRLPDDEILGQISSFVFAGHDTTTGALCRILHQLAQFPDVQEKLRQEVTLARKDGDIDYDMLMGLPYLDAVCRETLRVYPPLPSVHRVAREDITLPLMFPVKSKDGKTEIEELHLKEGTGLTISILNVNGCKAIWGEDADVWKPERWMYPLPESVASAHLPGVYASMMTFVGGGRACIGFKFAEMELKLTLSVLLEKIIFSPCSNDIEWKMGGLQFPVLKGSVDMTPQMRLKLSLIDD